MIFNKKKNHNATSRTSFSRSHRDLYLDEIAARYGLASEDARRVLRRIDAHFESQETRTVKKRPDLSKSLGRHMRLLHLFGQSLEHTDSSAVIRFFEQANLEQLSESVAVIDHLSGSGVPLYRLSDLSGLTDAFTRHLIRNRESLVRTGYPETSFAPSSWLDWLLTPLLFTKIPVSVFGGRQRTKYFFTSSLQPLSPTELQTRLHEGSLPRDAEGNLIFSYFWAKEAGRVLWPDLGDQPLVVKTDPRGGFLETVKIHLCDYEEAASIRELGSETAAALESNREKFFQIKWEVISICCDSLRTRDAEILWPRVFKVLQKKLKVDDLLFLTAIDQLYAEELRRREMIIPYDLANEYPFVSAGALFSLLMFVGHCEEEIRLGAFSKTASEIFRLTGGEPLLEIYLKSLGRPELANLDEALKNFAELGKEGRRLGKQIKKRVIKMFYEDFKGWEETFVDSTDSQSTLSAQTVVSPSPTHVDAKITSNTFRREDDDWLIVYEGKTIKLKPSKGLIYISHLLSHPETEFPALQISALANKVISEFLALYKSASMESIEELGLSLSGAGEDETLYTEETKENLRARLEKIEEGISLHKGTSKATHLEKEKQEIQSYLAKGQRLGRRFRKFTDENEKARASVSARIKGALNKIEDKHPSLYAHLNNSIKRGAFFSYSPEKAVTWDCGK